MNILIISSEYLYPQNVMDSCFELDQAKALCLQGQDARVLAGRTDIHPGQLMRSLLKKLLGMGGSNEFSNRLSYAEHLKLLRSAITGKYLLKTYEIQGVQCYEILASYFKRKYRFYDSFQKAGMQQFPTLHQDFTADLVHAHSRFLLAALLASKIKRDFSIPYVVTEHSDRYHKGMVNDYERELATEAFSKADRVFAVSEALKKSMHSVLPGNLSIEIMPNCLDLSFMEEEIARPLAKEFCFINVAAFYSYKNHKLLLEAFFKVSQNNPELRLKLVGTGETFDEMKKWAAEHDLESKVQFLGQLDRKGVIGALKSCHAFVLLSNFETFGVSIIEAHSLGLPAISTRCGGPESILHEGNGLLVERNAEAVAGAMLHLYEKYGDYDTAAIREEALKKYSPDLLAGKLVQSYQDVVKKGEN